MKVDIGIAEKNRKEAAGLLSALLADETVLYIKTRNAHWNVTGPDFSELHKFFEAQYDELEEIIDDVAERIRALGGVAVGTLKEYLALTRLEEAPGKYPPAKAVIAALLKDHQILIRQLRQDLVAANEKYQDAGTSDFLTGLMEQHEKMAWMLRAYLN